MRVQGAFWIFAIVACRTVLPSTGTTSHDVDGSTTISQTGLATTPKPPTEYGGWKPINSTTSASSVTFTPKLNTGNISEGFQETKRSYVLVYPPKNNAYQNTSPVPQPPLEIQPTEPRPPAKGPRAHQHRRQMSPPLRSYPTQMRFSQPRNNKFGLRTSQRHRPTGGQTAGSYGSPSVVFQRLPVVKQKNRRPNQPTRITSEQSANHHIQIQLLDGFILPSTQGKLRNNERTPGIRAVPISINDVPEIKLLLPDDVHQQLTQLHGQRQRQLQPGNNVPSIDSIRKLENPQRLIPNNVQSEGRKISLQNSGGDYNLANQPQYLNPGHSQGNSVRFPQQNSARDHQEREVKNVPQLDSNPQQHGNYNPEPQISNGQRTKFVANPYENNNVQLQEIRVNYGAERHTSSNSGNANSFRPIAEPPASFIESPQQSFSQPDPLNHVKRPQIHVSFPSINKNSVNNEQIITVIDTQTSHFRPTGSAVPPSPPPNPPSTIPPQLQNQKQYFAYSQDNNNDRTTNANLDSQNHRSNSQHQTQVQFQSHTSHTHTSQQNNAFSAEDSNPTNPPGQSHSYFNAANQKQFVSQEKIQQEHVEQNPDLGNVHVPFEVQQMKGIDTHPDFGSKIIEPHSVQEVRVTQQEEPLHSQDESTYFAGTGLELPHPSIQQTIDSDQVFGTPQNDHRSHEVSSNDQSRVNQDAYSAISSTANFPSRDAGNKCDCPQNCSPIQHTSGDSVGSSLKEIAVSVRADALFQYIRLPEEEVMAVLTSTGPYTLFMPSNEVLSRLPIALWDQWDHKGQGEMPLAFMNHVVAGIVTLDHMRQGGQMESRVQGSTLFINNNHNEDITVNGHRIIRGDIPGPQGGIIHVIDGTLCPVADHDIIDTLRTCNKYDGFLTLADVTQLMQQLQGGGPFTVFVPTNHALMKLPPDELTLLKENVTALRSFLEYHVINGAYFSGDLKDGQYIPSILKNHPLQVGVRVDDCHRRLVDVNMSPICKADIPAKNGVIHVIDWVLRPDDLGWCEGVILP